MEGIFGWAKNIAYFLIFLAAVEAVLPGGRYDKYIRFFSGTILILTVASPVTKGLGLEEKIAYAFEVVTFRQEASDFQGELEEMEARRLMEIQSQYEGTVSDQVVSLAKEQGIPVTAAAVEIDMDPLSSSYGHILKITMEAEYKMENIPKGGEAEGTDLSQEVKAAGTVMVEKISIGEEEKEEAASYEPTEAESELKKTLSGYYGLEEEHVEIKWKNDKR